MELNLLKPKNKTANVTQLLRKREYRYYKENPSVIQDEWCRSKRSIQTLGYWADLEGHQGCVNTINFSRSGDLIVSGSDDAKIKIWNVETQKCLDTLKGHVSNVFAADFLPYTSNKEIVTGGNDADLRHYDLEKKVCTVYSHHNKKILRISFNPHVPDTFLSCSADGTIRMIDVRKSYTSTRQHTFEEYSDDERNDFVIPQAFGGGRASRQEESEKDVSSLVLDYSKEIPTTAQSRRRAGCTLYSVDFHPDGHRFIVSSSLGDVRLFDLRKIVENDPSKSFVRVYKNFNGNSIRQDITGCVFSKDGSEIVATVLGDFIYVFDTEMDTAVKPYKGIYRGHYSKNTIKPINFYGPNSEYVVSGSDDAMIYIWDKKSTEILRILEGHDAIVNCIVGHPIQPMIASSGIDSVVKLWQNMDDYPDENQLKNRVTQNAEIAQNNIQHLRTPTVQPICIQQ